MAQLLEDAQLHGEFPKIARAQADSLPRRSLASTSIASINLRSDHLRMANGVVFREHTMTNSDHLMYVRALLSSKSRIHELVHGSPDEPHEGECAHDQVQHHDGILRDLCVHKDKSHSEEGYSVELLVHDESVQAIRAIRDVDELLRGEAQALFSLAFLSSSRLSSQPSEACETQALLLVSGPDLGDALLDALAQHHGVRVDVPFDVTRLPDGMDYANQYVRVMGDNY